MKDNHWITSMLEKEADNSVSESIPAEKTEPVKKKVTKVSVDLDVINDTIDKANSIMDVLNNGDSKFSRQDYKRLEKVSRKIRKTLKELQSTPVQPSSESTEEENKSKDTTAQYLSPHDIRETLEYKLKRKPKDTLIEIAKEENIIEDGDRIVKKKLVRDLVNHLYTKEVKDLQQKLK